MGRGADGGGVAGPGLEGLGGAGDPGGVLEEGRGRGLEEGLAPHPRHPQPQVGPERRHAPSPSPTPPRDRVEGGGGDCVEGACGDCPPPFR